MKSYYLELVSGNDEYSRSFSKAPECQKVGDKSYKHSGGLTHCEVFGYFQVATKQKHEAENPRRRWFKDVITEASCGWSLEVAALEGVALVP